MIPQQAFLMKQFVAFTDYDGGSILDCRDDGYVPTDTNEEHVFITPFKLLELGTIDGSNVTYIYHKIYGTGTEQMVGMINILNNAGQPRVKVSALSWDGGAGWQYDTQDIEFDKWYFFVTSFQNAGSNNWATEVFILGPDDLDINLDTAYATSTCANASMLASADDFLIVAGDTVNTNTGTVLVCETVVALNVSTPHTDFRHPLIHGTDTGDYYTLEEYCDGLSGPLDVWDPEDVEQCPGDYEAVSLISMYPEDGTYIHNMSDSVDIIDTNLDATKDKVDKLTDFSTIDDDDAAEVLSFHTTLQDYKDHFLLQDEAVNPNDPFIPEDLDSYEFDPGHSVPPIGISDLVSPSLEDLSAVYSI